MEKGNRADHDMKYESGPVQLPGTKMEGTFKDSFGSLTTRQTAELQSELDDITRAERLAETEGRDTYFE